MLTRYAPRRVINTVINSISYGWRLLATACSFTLFGVGGVIIPWLAIPLFYLNRCTLEQRQAKARKLVHYTFKCFIYFMRFMGILRWQTHAIERLQTPRQLILANHPTLLDVVFLVAFTPHASCIVKQSLLKNPAMRGFIHLTGFITNDGGPQLIDDAKQAIEKGGALIIFPEGTRTTPNKPMKFQRGAANIAARSGCHITPVLIDCKPLSLSKQHKWYNIPHKKMQFTLHILDEFSIQSYLELPPTLASRHLTNDLEQYFSQELKRYE